MKTATSKRAVKAKASAPTSKAATKDSNKPVTTKKQRRPRPHNITLSDLFLWVTVVDECQHHPMGAFERASISEGLESTGVIQQRLKVLEERFGRLFMLPKRDNENMLSASSPAKSVGKATKKKRSAMPTPRGGALAELFAMIEHLYLFSLRTNASESDREIILVLKRVIFGLLPMPISRELEREALDRTLIRNRILRTYTWSYRVRKQTRTGEPKKFSDLPRMRSRYPNDPI